MNSLEVNGVSKTFKSGGNVIAALNDVDLSVKKGSILALLGENGAGKSSLIKICTGLMVPDSGSVLISGKPISGKKDNLSKIGLLLEGNRNLYWRLTPLENLEYFGGLKGMIKRHARERGKKLLDQFNLMHKAKSPIQSLSRGMQQKVSIICSVINSPEILFLDEPTLGLDRESTNEILDMVMQCSAEGCSVVVTSHQIEIIESITSDVAILKSGKIICNGDLRRLLKNNDQVFEIYYESPILEADRIKLLHNVPGISIEENRVVFIRDNAALKDIINLTSHLSVVSINPVINTLSKFFHNQLMTTGD
jgi:ABC-2 type transport system ATP-binding protein